MSFYTRQENMNLNTNIKIAIIGCGGVGFNVALMLAMAGVENIYLFDPDTIEQHNLNRLPVPFESIGENKANLCRKMIKQMRPDINVYKFPFVLKDTSLPSEGVDWIIDCTDKFESQKLNYEIACKVNAKYCKSGYDGENMSISEGNPNNSWDTNEEGTPDGYQIIPSWAAPAMIIASLTVGKVLKYHNKEVSTSLKNLYM